MARILLVDMLGDVGAGIEKPLRDAGWEVLVTGDAAACRSTAAEAIVLATDTAGLACAQVYLEAARDKSGAPVILIVDLDRSGWDRTLGTPEALGVDALFDRPVDAQALVHRLTGILAARRPACGSAASPEMSSILECAIANEEAAAAFYRRAAQRVSDPDTRKVLELLMRDEEEHKRIVEEFRSGARPLPEGTAQTATLVEAFGTPEFGAALSAADAFLLAATKERLAMEFYANWADLYPEGEQRQLLLRLSEVERSHKARVEAMFTNAAFPESW
jgi:rubrerythrin